MSVLLLGKGGYQSTAVLNLQGNIIDGNGHFILIGLDDGVDILLDFLHVDGLLVQLLVVLLEPGDDVAEVGAEPVLGQSNYVDELDLLD